MNVFRYELKNNFKVTLIWLATILALTGLYVSIYPSMISGIDFQNLLSNFPEAFKKSFGISDTTFSAFFGLYAMILNLVLLIGSVQAMNLGISLNSKEIKDKTADFLLSKPISRRSILTQKLLAGLTLLLMTNIAFLVGAWWIINAVIDEPLSVPVFVRSSLTLLFVQIFFLAIGFLTGITLKKVKSVIAVSLPVVFGLYIFGLLDTLVGENKIKYLTPFKFFDLGSLTTGDNYQAGILVYMMFLVALSVCLGYFIYTRKDINSL